MCQTSPAGAGNIVAAHWAFVAGDIDNLNHIGIILIPAHSHFNAFFHNGTFLIDTAPHGRLAVFHDDFWNLRVTFEQLIFKGIPRHFAEYLVF